MDNNNISIPTSPAPQLEPSYKVYSGATRSTIGGEVESMGNSKYSPLDEQKAQIKAGTASILSTARNAGGSPTGQRNPSSTTVETIPGNQGSRMSLEVAVRLGYLQVDSAGNYSEVSQGDPNGQDEDQLEGGVELFPARDEQAFNDAITDIPQQLYEAAMIKSAASIAATGTIDSKLVTDLASTSGLDASLIQQAQDIGVAGFQVQADAAITRLGVIPCEVYQWGRENHPGLLSAAIRLQVTVRSTKGYSELATKFKASTVPASLKGYETKTERGVGLVKVNGMWSDLRTAARMGLI